MNQLSKRGDIHILNEPLIIIAKGFKKIFK
jgi:hypothetical protein